MVKCSKMLNYPTVCNYIMLADFGIRRYFVEAEIVILEGCNELWHKVSIEDLFEQIDIKSSDDND